MRPVDLLALRTALELAVIVFTANTCGRAVDHLRRGTRDAPRAVGLAVMAVLVALSIVCRR